MARGGEGRVKRAGREGRREREVRRGSRKAPPWMYLLGGFGA